MSNLSLTNYCSTCCIYGYCKSNKHTCLSLDFCDDFKSFNRTLKTYEGITSLYYSKSVKPFISFKCLAKER